MEKNELIVNLEQTALAMNELSEACKKLQIDDSNHEVFLEEVKKLSPDKLDYILSLLDKISNNLGLVEEESGLNDLSDLLKNIDKTA